MLRKNKLVLPEGTIIPNHVAVILDGNGRWARAHNLPTTKGHEHGASALETLIENSREVGVHTLTLWGFSTENWKRPPMEVKKIMDLVRQTIEKHLEKSKKEGVRFVHLGSKERLPGFLVDLLKKAEEETRHNKKHILNLALDYGGHDEILRAVKNIIEDGVPASKINEELFSSYLDTKGQPYPNPDLLIRTSGEQRTSGLMPWQLSYCEIYFEEEHLPSMDTEKLRKIFMDYSRRRRRFGGKDQVRHFKFSPEVTAKLEVAWWRLAKIPEGTKFTDYAMEHLKEQFGLSREHAGYAARYMIEAINEGNLKKWKKAREAMGKFYHLIRDEVKLAFEPTIVASMDVKLMKSIHEHKEANEIEEATRTFLSELYRISDLQARKAAHLRTLATAERSLAEQGMGDHHWDLAEEYLALYYQALKERVA